MAAVRSCLDTPYRARPRVGYALRMRSLVLLLLAVVLVVGGCSGEGASDSTPTPTDDGCAELNAAGEEAYEAHDFERAAQIGAEIIARGCASPFPSP